MLKLCCGIIYLFLTLPFLSSEPHPVPQVFRRQDVGRSERSISGEEIPYVFGIPLLNEEGPLSHHKFSLSEQLLSESILIYFTNFAKTGNPNAPRRLEYLTQSLKEWQQYDVYWPEYDFANQSYLSLGVPPHVGHHYRSEMTQYWNEILPDLLSNPTKLKQKPDQRFGEVHNTTYQKPSISSFLNPKKPNEDTSPWTYGVVRTSPREYNRGKRPYKSDEEVSKQMDRPLEDTGMNTPDDVQTSMVPYFVAVTVSLLLLNAIVIGLYCYRKRKKQHAEETPKQKVSESVYSIVECSEGSRTDDSEKPGRLKKCISDTTDNHTKVKRWIQQEILDKCSKSRKNSEVSLGPVKPVGKSNSISEGSSRATPMPKPILKNSQRIYQSSEDLKTAQRKSVQKVSVGIDATPSTRGESVLKQTPIEITKSLDRGMLKLGTSEENLQSTRRSRTSISLQMLPTNGDVKFITSGEPEIIQLGHPHPESPKSNFQTFLTNEDINVTSRDSPVPSTFDTFVDPLENIQRRNFPKVLPDFPDSKTMLRLSFPQPSIDLTRKQNPPPPPPRVSTLQRNNKNHSDSPHEEDKSKTTPEEDSSTTDSSKASVVEKSKWKTEKTGKRREQPSIVIQPKIGPKKQGQKDKPRINLQSDKKEPPRVLDSKGPSDKIPQKQAKSFRI